MCKDDDGGCRGGFHVALAEVSSGLLEEGTQVYLTILFWEISNTLQALGENWSLPTGEKAPCVMATVKIMALIANWYASSVFPEYWLNLKGMT